ncbi:hypothetical protein [Vagococcus sp. WN89Y]|uniref:hypothetical protein n=1 Tax=Vagococcus sp. WN89Y TaxID=3457258 RepID=UPI003FCED2BB
MANAFDFQLNADDNASATIIRIEEAIRLLNPQLDKTKEGLKLGGDDSVDSVSKVNQAVNGLSKAAKDCVQFIGDIVPPLKMVTALSGLGGGALAFNAIKNNLKEFADYGYRVDTMAKNVSMTTHAFQELTGAMVENGSAREAAESAIADLYNKSESALLGGNSMFASLLQQQGIDIHLTKEGLADVSRLVDDINKMAQSMTPGKAALWINSLGLSPEILSLVRNSTDEVKRFKDQAQRDGLIFSDKDIQNALAFKQQMNQIAALWEGLKMQSQARLGGWLRDNPDIKKITKYEKDNENNFYHGDKQQDIMARARRDKSFKGSLTFMEGLELAIGRPGKDLQEKLNKKYSDLWDAQKKAAEQSASQGGYVLPGVPYNEPLNITKGIRNNNPGNLRNAPNTVGYSGGFPTFASSSDGLSALARQLTLYGGRGKNTLNEIISTYAPPQENNTQAYIDHVSEITGFKPGQRLDLSDPVVMQALMAAIVKHENGTQPYSSEEIQNSVSNAMNSERWTGRRSPDGQNQKEDLYSGDSILRQNEQSNNEGLAAAFRSALQDSKMQIELTLINPQTGERNTMTGNGPRVTRAMPY